MVRALLTACLVAAPAAAADRQPNVLFVLADDQRFDTVRALGNPEVTTPTLDALAGRGFVFTNAYCQGSMVPAVCAPSRTMILTGKSLFRIPAPNAKTYGGPTLGSAFTKAGYATLCVSKPGNSFALGHTHFGKTVHVPHVGAATNQRCADAVIEFVKAHDGAKPFFVYLAPSMPHDPRTAEPEFHRMYDPAKLTLPKNFLREHPFDNGELAVRDEKLAKLPRDPVEMKQHLADYYACVTSLDHHLGRVLDAIKGKGALDNTLVVFTSDQGLAVGGRHGLMGKQNLYEHFKSPLIVAGAGVPKGSSAALAYLFDLFPTVCDATGVEVPKVCEGASLWPIIKGDKKAVRETLFAAYRDVQRMARSERWKLIWYPKVDRVQLFDLLADPWEVDDLSAKPTHRARLGEMRKVLAAEQATWGDKLGPP